MPSERVRALPISFLSSCRRPLSLLPGHSLVQSPPLLAPIARFLALTARLLTLAGHLLLTFGRLTFYSHPIGVKRFILPK